eukprot:3936159-Prymnesium_polylepis.1
MVGARRNVCRTAEPVKCHTLPPGRVQVVPASCPLPCGLPHHKRAGSRCPLRSAACRACVCPRWRTPHRPTLPQIRVFPATCDFVLCIGVGLIIPYDEAFIDHGPGDVARVNIDMKCLTEAS